MAATKTAAKKPARKRVGAAREITVSVKMKATYCRGAESWVYMRKLDDGRLHIADDPLGEDYADWTCTFRRDDLEAALALLDEKVTV